MEERNLKKKDNNKLSRRRFIKFGSTAAAGIAASVGLPAFLRQSKASEVYTLKVQTCWDAGTVGYTKFTEFCKHVGEMSDGKINLKGFPAGAIVGPFEMFDAVKNRVFDAFHGFDNWFSGKIPVASFFTSFPFGMDRPDQWETWFYRYGGIKFAREAYAKHNMVWVGNIQHDDNLIHSKIPIRSFEEFKGKKIRFGGAMIADFFRQAGVATILLPGGEVYPALEKGVIDAADYVGAAINYNMGYGEIAKYIIMGPPTTPCIHQPVDMMSFVANAKSWAKLPKHLQLLLTAAIREHSWDQYTAIQEADNEAYEKLKGQGVEIIRLSEEDVAKFRKFAPSVWVRWAKKNPLSMKAFKSQWEFLKSEKIGYYSDADLIDTNGKRLTL